MLQPTTQKTINQPGLQCIAAPNFLQPQLWTPRQEIQALYLHVPFCFHKCHYCDFYSLAQGPDAALDRHAPFVDRLCQELVLRAGQSAWRISTIFCGGGTPTLLSSELWRRLLEQLGELGALDQVREFTVEANPETVTPELLTTLRQGGVNRLSIGAQSFQPALLKALERWHEPASVVRAVAMARDAGFDNYNLDLIFAIPGQDLAQLDSDLDAALALAPEHLSVYGLTYEPNTALTQRLRMGQVQRAEEDLEAQMYRRVIQRLSEAGFEHYEISNFARRREGVSRRCAHNMGYWTNVNFVGVGPSASSHVAGRRWKNVPHLGQYMAQKPEPPILDFEHLPADQSAGEALMLRLRLLEGAPLPWLSALLGADDSRWEQIQELIDLGMLERRDDHLRLTARGLMVADAVISRLL